MSTRRRASADAQRRRSGSSGPVDVRWMDPRDLRWLVDPQRAYLVQATVEAAKGAKTLAAELGCPVTRLYHHL